jgi:hypothetical protein
MKKFYSSLFAVLIAAGASAQGYDLEMTLVTPTSGSTQDQSSPISVDFTLTNNGPDALSAGDTLWFVYADGMGQNIHSLTNVAGQASGAILQADLTSGQSLTASTFLGPISLDVTSWANGETVSILCLGAGADALTQNGDAEETNPLNNFDSFLLGTTSSLEEAELSILAFPVPAKDVLNIQSSEAVAQVTVLNMNGQVVAQSTTASVNVSALQSGVYLYQVETVTGTVIQNKFVKQ